MLGVQGKAAEEGDEGEDVGIEVEERRASIVFKGWGSCSRQG